MRAGRVQYRTDKAGIVQCTIGRASFTPDQLKTNLIALIEALNKSRPKDTEGHLSPEDQRVEHDGRGCARGHDRAGDTGASALIQRNEFEGTPGGKPRSEPSKTVGARKGLIAGSHGILRRWCPKTGAVLT
jgi:hypothetical protein